MKTMKKMMTLLAVAGLVLALAPAAQAGTILDNVENHLDYTFIATAGSGTSSGAPATPYVGLTAVVGPNVVYVYSSDKVAHTGTITYTAGFGPGNTIQAGTYVYTMSLGQLAAPRPGFQQWDMRLQTTSGRIVLANVVTNTPYVPPAYVHNVTATPAWTNTTKTYTINPSDPLIGQEFTWAADWSNRPEGNTTFDEIFAVFDAVSIEFTAAIPTVASITLDNNTVASNAPPGELVGTLSMLVTNPANFAFSVVASGPDYTYFDIATGTTNLRTAKWIDSDSYDIMILATNSGDGFWVTNAFTITATDPGGRPNFVVGATVAPDDIADDTVVGVMQSSPSATTYSLVGGRTDMFDITGVTNLVVDNAATAWTGLVLGDVAYVSVDAVSGSFTNTLIVGVEVASTALPAGTIFLFQ